MENLQLLLSIHNSSITRTELRLRLVENFPDSKYSAFVRIEGTTESYVVKPCAHCSKDYNMNLKNRGKYCSTKCVGAANNLSKEVECLNCNKTFIKKNAEIIKHPNNFCTSSCAALFHNKERVVAGFSTKGKTTPTLCGECLAMFNKSIHSISKVCDACKNKKEGASNTSERRAIQAKQISKKHREFKKQTDIQGNLEWIPKSNTTCEICKQDTGRLEAKYCDECRSFKSSNNRIEAIKAGKSNVISIKCKYSFNEKIINCDSKLEYSCLDFFEKTYTVLDIDRAQTAIPYVFEGKKRLFLPDFQITTTDGIFIVECKSATIGKSLNEKWRLYKETAAEKQKVLFEWCATNGYTAFWYEKKLNNKFYNSLSFL